MLDTHTHTHTHTRAKPFPLFPSPSIPLSLTHGHSEEDLEISESLVNRFDLHGHLLQQTSDDKTNRDTREGAAKSTSKLEKCKLRDYYLLSIN